MRDGEKYIRLEDLPPDSEYTPEERRELEQLYGDSLREIQEGEIVPGKIIAIGEKEVAVDIGFKAEGSVPLEEFDDPASLKVGDALEVFLESVENSEGQLLLSKRKADFMRVWDRVKDVYASDGIIRGRCVRRIKGGMVVDLGGVDAFLPGSQIDVRPVRDFDAYIGTEMDFRILKINDLRKNIVVSHKVLKEESLREVREKLLGSLKVGDILEGTVKNITDFGVFVDLGGVDGLLHITDLSWGRVAHPSEVVQLDQKIRVKVLNYDKERKRISLGLKQLYAHLWDEIDRKYQVGQKVQGRVVSLAKYGAFVEVEPGIEGLVHVSEMSWTQHVKHPNQIVREGEYIQVMILSIDKENKKISLGLKQTEEDPWESFEAKYRPDTRHKGVVRDLVPFGAFVELEDGIDGLVHISDLSWTRKVRHPGEVLKKGQEIEVVVLDFNRDERRIALGHKQIEENPWDAFAREHPVGSKLTGTVTKTMDKGILVELPGGLEGFVPNSHLSRKYYDGKKRTVQTGDVLKLVIIEFDKSDRKVVLSNTKAEKKEQSAKAVSYAESQKGRVTPTLADALEEDNPLLLALKAAKEEESKEKKAKKKTTKKKAEAEAETAAEAEAAPEEKAEAKPAKKKKAEAKPEAEAEPAEEEKAGEKPKAKAAEEAKAEEKPKAAKKKAPKKKAGDDKGAEPAAEEKAETDAAPAETPEKETPPEEEKADAGE
ncbi:MAG TPA: 30S ribosomal protein S1 [Bacteroidetes bacterium]|nr:30S ribosomal protein S1 [Bacteroidota bacterium]